MSCVIIDVNENFKVPMTIKMTIVFGLLVEFEWYKTDNFNVFMAGCKISFKIHCNMNYH